MNRSFFVQNSHIISLISSFQVIQITKKSVPRRAIQAEFHCVLCACILVGIKPFGVCKTIPLMILVADKSH